MRWEGRGQEGYKSRVGYRMLIHLLHGELCTIVKACVWSRQLSVEWTDKRCPYLADKKSFCNKSTHCAGFSFQKEPANDIFAYSKSLDLGKVFQMSSLNLKYDWIIGMAVSRNIYVLLFNWIRR